MFSQLDNLYRCLSLIDSALRWFGIFLIALPLFIVQRTGHTSSSLLFCSTVLMDSKCHSVKGASIDMKIVVQTSFKGSFRRYEKPMN